jgi:hypothetical protein
MSNFFADTASRILARWNFKPSQRVESVPEFDRRSLPEATMNLLLRFETDRGPRTIVAPRIPWKVASLIAEAMVGAGHYAEMIDDCLPLTVAERLAQRQPQPAPRESVLPLTRRLA